MLSSILAVFIGSGLGGVVRWLLSRWLNGSYPVGTLLANVLGCFLLGAFNAWLSKYYPNYATLRLLLVVGFCGGFTTFSTFMNENFMMLRGGQLLLSAGYAALSLAVGLLAVWGGNKLFS
ncbi:MAG: fluoride efflux transporter CrcB [Bacteroidaceae bacterium]|nr:fluoride efflux transporter CrcB [Candidatus Minthousia equi]MCQ2247132.1 fluoride efflux transporter CrcB [Bacteroidaceae bacterium]MDO4956836.1 fluoride efflux transporter CrcB [Bacteroidales bacterium]